MTVGTSKTIASAWFKDDHFGESRVAFEPEDLKNAQMLVLWGGEDISPSIYNEVPVYAHAGPTPSKRDAGEMNLVKEAVRLGIPILGVCRG